MITEQDKAYLAGIIDGEGSIGVNRSYPSNRSRRHIAKLDIAQSDKPFLDYLRNKWDGLGQVLESRHSDGVLRRPAFYWHIQTKQVAWLLEQVLPYLVIKKNQAEGIIELERNILITQAPKKLTQEQLEYRDWVAEQVSRFNQRELVGDYVWQ